MARIRTIKPDFFRHEVLQEIEIENPGCYAMLVYSALWGHCDKHGLFEWKPRQMQLDIIPFIWEATGKRLRSTLEVLVNNGFITVYTDGKKYYGHIESFTDHQRIQGKESQAPSPLPNVEGLQLVDISEVQEKHRGSNGEAPENRQRIQEGKGREGNKEEEGNEECKKALTVSDKPKRASAQKMTDEEWLDSLKNNPAYAGMNFDVEIGKAQAWALTKGRKCSRAFLLNWFNRADKNITLQGANNGPNNTGSAKAAGGKTTGIKCNDYTTDFLS